MKKIDAHAHVGYFGSWCDVGITAREMVEAMQRYDIEKSIVSYPDNTVARDAAAEFPDRLVPLAWMDPNRGEQALAEFSDLVENHHFAGLKLHPLFNAYTANDAVVFPLIEYARKKNLPVFIHSGHPPFSLPWSIGQLAEVFPDVRFVMIHMGHGHGIYIQAAIDTAVKYANIWLENSGMPMHTKTREAYLKVGSSRVFWGSDIPFHHYAVEILRTEVSGLTESQLEDVFFNNIKNFMGW
ncbi:MAG: amidohydrolase family protein [Synergistaceae bacterium]|jgi:predicted TIM-barrel fold metal-dependent hydrolase|nr:amidohydrolase family protein [Synergistaceae bacterium]